ncbi:MAG: beta-ketoacyl-[acyl-carrier-protein] synthase family protein [Acidobacteria bacterium]|nr:beta-ketoacyl-[acyl-carrier-protein] synthase family protein [Acidobacteriota bacterium]MBV9626297.1 beta-ketoacyl-[acyl-carrier-protein] synthase family protein [Acidobacteriota bacterium]
MLARVVITGMGVVSPNGIGKEAFCRAVLAGKSGVRRISRFDSSRLPVHIAGEIQDFDEFRWVTPRERKHVSRTVPLSLAAATEAIRDSGLDLTSMSIDEKREMGIVLGTGGGAQDFSEHQYRLWHGGQERQVSLFSIPSGTMGTISSELSMRFGLRGYSHVVTAGCTSSTDAVGYAWQHIQAGALPLFITGGVDSPITEGIVKGYTMIRALTPSWNEQPERASRPFSRDRDGFVLAEGSWMFVLEDYEHAKARGARIYAEIAGYAATCEAFHRVRMSDSPEEPARAITLALEEAGLRPVDLDYVSLHGTSTEMNDRVETRALKLALGDHAYRIPMSGLKSQIGHAQGACGAASIAATLIAMEHGRIPPTINLEEPDPECDLDYVPEAGRKRWIEHALANCVGFGSKNSAVVLRKV